MISLLAKLGLDTSGFATGLARAEVAANKAGVRIGNSLKTQFAAVFGTAAIAAAVKSVVEFGGKISDLSKRTFLSKRALQEFDYIAGQTGTTLESFVTAEQKLAQAQQNAIDGNKELVETFGRYGLKLEDLKRINPHQLFMLLSGAIGSTDLSTQQLDDVLKLMGRSAGDIIPAMKEGFDGMVSRAEKLGVILEDDVIKKLDDIGDRMSDLKLRARRPAAAVAEFGVDILESIMAVARAGTAAGSDRTGNPFKAFQDSLNDFNNEVVNAVGAQSLFNINRRNKSGGGALSSEARIVGPFGTWDDLARLQAADQARATRSLSTSMDVLDPLARIGGYTGGDPAVKNIMQKQLEKLEAIEENTKGGADGI